MISKYSQNRPFLNYSVKPRMFLLLLLCKRPTLDAKDAINATDAIDAINAIDATDAIDAIDATDATDAKHPLAFLKK